MQVVKGEGGFRNVLMVREVLVLRRQDGQERGLGRRVEGSVPREACTWLGAWPEPAEAALAEMRVTLKGWECSAWRPHRSLSARTALSTIYMRRGCLA